MSDWPNQADELVTVFAGYINTIKKCPYCDTYYKYKYEIDNEIFYCHESEELTRLTKRQAMKLLKEVQGNDT